MTVHQLPQLIENVREQFQLLSEEQRVAFEWRARWLMQAHRYQMEPSGDHWSIWLMLAGRGAGKTRTAAESVGWWGYRSPGTRWLVSAPTSGDVRDTCFEGDSGLLNVIPKALIRDYNRSLHELVLTNGTLFKGIPASEPERFRGPQFHGAWCDELAAWERLDEAWDMLQFAVRLGQRTRILATTTPRPKQLIIELVGREDDDVVVRRASTYENIANLAPNFQKQIFQYEGTRIGRQEIYAELIDAEESGIIKRDWFKLWPANKPFPVFKYVLQSYDCATSEKTHNDPTACSVWGIFEPSADHGTEVMLIDCWQEFLQYPDLRPKLIEQYRNLYGSDGEFGKGKHVDLILIEDKSAGISLIQDLQRARLPVRAYNPGRADKLQRLNLVSHLIANKRVWVPESGQHRGYVASWAEPLISQICAFPDVQHDDLVDTTTQALRLLNDMRMIGIDISDDPADDYVPERPRQRVNPYAV
jgi:predicted phage terminase large subunit-like protein